MKAGYSEHIYQSAEGLALYYRSYPPASDAPRRRQSATLLCLPGLTRNSRDFESLALHLASRYRVLTPDVRGRGRSAYDPQWSNYQPARYVDDAFRLLDLENVGRCIVIGTSLGGLMGMLMAAQQPPRIVGLVLNDIGPELDPRGLARIRTYAGRMPPVRTWEEAAAQSRMVHEHAFPGLPDEEWMAIARRTYRETPEGTIRSDLDSNITRAFGDASAPMPDLWPVFSMLRAMPLLVLRGMTSDLFSQETLERMQRVKPDLRAVIVPNRGHAPMLSEPEARRAIDEFVEHVASA
jgi:pimeloyl-ACP methyl ester carboxylesterase